MRKNLHWIAFGILLLALVIYMTKPFMSVFVYGIFIYYVARREHEKIANIIGHRKISAVISLMLLVLPTIMLILYTANVAFFEFGNFISNYNIDIMNRVLGVTGEMFRSVNLVELLSLAKQNTDVGIMLMGMASRTVGFMIRLLLVFIVSYYLLVDGSKLRKWFTDVFFEKQSGLANEFMSEVDSDLYRVFFGNILSAGFTAIVGGVVFTFLNIIAPNEHLIIPYPVLLGLLCGIGNLIPAIGIKIVWVPMAVYLILQTYVHELWYGVWYLILFLILVNILVDMFPDMVLRPYVSGRKIHRGLLLLSYIFGPIAFGFPGLFIGPIVLILSTRFMQIVVPRLKSA